MSDRPLLDKWEEYAAQLDACISGELDENTKKELRYAFTSGAFAAFTLLSQAHRTGEFAKMFNHLCDEGMKLMKEMQGSPRIHIM